MDSPTEQVELNITHLQPDGCGYTDDQQHAVYGGLPGERVLAEPLARKRGRRYYRAIALLESNPSKGNLPKSDHPQSDHQKAARVQPVCKVADRCGGCSFQHLAHDAQLRLKQAQLLDALTSNQPSTPPETITPPITSSIYGYRGKARLGAKHVLKKGEVLVGFREKQRSLITETTACPILRPPVDELILPLRKLIASLTIRDHVPQIEVAMGDNSLALVFRHLEEPTAGDLDQFRAFLDEHADKHANEHADKHANNYSNNHSNDHPNEKAGKPSILIYLQPGGPDSVHLLCRSGQADLTYSLPDIELAFEPLDFIQVNPGINRQMVAAAIRLLALEPTDRVMDAFCGLGNFSLPIARHCAAVRGYEGAAGSVERARSNAARNGISNAEFHVADLLNPGDTGFSDISFNGINKIMLDPPRSGAENLVKALASQGVERVVYASCNPLSLARDVKSLVENGFRFRSAGIVDMFPHTTHVESLALLTR